MKTIQEGKKLIVKETPQDRYIKANIKSYTLKLNKRTEKDIIEQLDSQPNKQGYIKGLISKDIQK